MSRRCNPIATFGAVAALALLGGCERPTHNPARLRAIKAEARVLMNSNPGDARVPPAQWPRTIASLKPEFVNIRPNGAHITTRVYFDGGWGYFVPRRESEPPEPADMYELAGEGVYWWHPY